MWKSVKELLKTRGLLCNSPRECFSELIKEGLIPESYERTLAEIIQIRNQLVHVYDNDLARKLYKEITSERIYKTIKAVYEVLKNLGKDS